MEATGAAAGVGSGAGGAAAGASSLAGAAEASTLKSLKAGTSSSSSTMTIIGSPTWISPDPASAKILATTPSSCASKSTVALSVSTLQMTSPAENESPASKFQEPMEPDSIV